MKMTSKPAASHSTIVSRVLRATPPRDPAEGEGRMKMSGLDDMLSMRVLSPRIEPPLRSDAWVDGQHRQSVVQRYDHVAHGLDECRLAGARNARDADAHRPPGVGQASLDDLLRLMRSVRACCSRRALWPARGSLCRPRRMPSTYSSVEKVRRRLRTKWGLTMGWSATPSVTFSAVSWCVSAYSFSKCSIFEYDVMVGLLLLVLVFAFIFDL